MCNMKHKWNYFPLSTTEQTCSYDYIVRVLCYVVLCVLFYVKCSVKRFGTPAALEKALSKYFSFNTMGEKISSVVAITNLM